MFLPMQVFWKWSLTVALVSISALTDGLPSRHMDPFIRLVEKVEEENPGLGPAAVLRGLRRAGGSGDALVKRFLSPLSNAAGAPVMDASRSDAIARALRHGVTEEGQEEGVVLTADGTTVALEPLLLGVEAGLLPVARRHPRMLYPFPLATGLGLAFQAFHNSSASLRLGPNGCWDDPAAPAVFTLSGAWSLATEAQLNGWVDGVILGSQLATAGRRPATLSGLLRGYYGLDAGVGGLGGRFVSRLRRDNFRALVDLAGLQRQVLFSLDVARRLSGAPPPEPGEKGALKAAVREGMREFVRTYVDCPAIIPRCQWGAEPYRGTPTQLSLPLSFMYIHHTYEPSKPCLTFERCSANMRSMQRFHQDDRGWDDIGYSFVAGSDGYIYEGRGWLWQGAHTKGYNSKGYGVSFIGDYTGSLPAQSAMALVRDRLAQCAVTGGRLRANFTLHGHRQLVNTSCPGDALYAEIQSWEHFGEVQT